jgi:D-aminoacyl-tRNA deacylase
MYSKILIVASKLDKAGINITTQLSQFGEFKFYLVDKEIIFTESLDLDKINEHDFIIFASKHKSEKREKTLSIHAPGNWKWAEFGGEEKKVCKSSAQFQKQLFEQLQKNYDKYHMKDYKITLEATHHGPLIDKPCVFIEIGSTENEWIDRKAGFVIARTISETIKNFKPNPYHEVAIAIGGPHYCPNFNRIQMKSNVAISHIIPQYVLPLSEEIVQEAIDKTEEEVDFALLDWKGLGTSEKRQEATNILDRLHIRYKRTSEANREY